MTTAKQQPATPYDAEIADIMASQKQGSTDFWKVYSLRNQCEGWLRRDADLAPLHRQLVEALVIALDELAPLHSSDHTCAIHEESVQPICRTLLTVRNSLDAARKAGL